MGGQHGGAFAVAGDHGGDGVPGDQLGVSPDGVGKQERPERAHAGEIVDVHHQGILGQALEGGKVPGLLPVEIGEDGLGARAVGVDEDALLGIAGQGVRQDLAESSREQAGMFALDGLMDLALVGRGPSIFVADGVGHGANIAFRPCGPVAAGLRGIRHLGPGLRLRRAKARR